MNPEATRDAEKIIYAKTLPESIENDRARYGLQRHSEREDDFVRSFLSRVAQDRDSKTETDKLKYKMHTFDVPKKWKRTVPESGKKRITAKERKQLKLFDLPKEQQKYEMYLPLHKLWVQYMRSMVGFDRIKPDTPTQSWYSKLLKADYHGCLLTVSRSKCPSLVGQTGILVQETKNTFKIVTKENTLKTIPKESCVFTFALKGYVFTIYGKHFQFKASERAHRKYKTKKTLDL